MGTRLKESDVPQNSLEEVRIYGEIGDDPAELETVADAVARGCSICYARIKSLRALVEAVQRRPGTNLAPPREERPEEWTPPDGDSSDESLTALRIYGGEILDGDCGSLDIRVTLALATRFAGDASFEEASFAGDASFDGASFAGTAWFRGASFARDASFNRTSFAGDASFEEASFAGEALFDRATFEGGASFRAATFAAEASFEDATFAGEASLRGATFAGDASLREATFAGDASFEDATFAGEASFDKATFAKEAFFDKATFAGAASFDKATFEGTGWFGGAIFAGAVEGDLRRCFLRTVKFGKRIGVPRRIWHWATRVSWQQVRALGQLQILNRVSLFALIAVPVLVACWPAVRALTGAYHRGVAESHAAMDRLLLQIERAASSAPMTDDARRRVLEVTEQASATSTAWQERLAEIVSESPYIGHTLSLLFFAAVFVTLGLLMYQVLAAEDVRKYDKDEFIDRAHLRYHEEATDRDDGLRRSIEHLEMIAKRRPDRHPNLVRHHGDTIWIPPRDRIDWFEKWKPPGNVSTDTRPHDADRSKDAPLAIVPGAERRRITIEEGAAAEYWLKSRKSIGGAWVSFLFYLIGILCLLSVLVIQAKRVAEAAGWLSG